MSEANGLSNNGLKVVAESPTKLIITGEHYVVYGAPAIAMAVDRRHKVELTVMDDGSDRMDVENVAGNGTVYPDRVEGPRYLEIYRSVMNCVTDKTGERIGHVHVRVVPDEDVPKGMGTSAAICAALALTLFRRCDVTPDTETLFDCVQSGETVAHGGRPSGIDARTVIYGGGVIFRKEFDPVRYTVEKTGIEFPEGTGMLVVDTYKESGKRESTGELVKRFAEKHGLSSANDPNRYRVVKEYIPVFNGIREELHKKGDPERLGALFDKNHELLALSGVSSDSIEKARTVAKENGALGSKLTGAGGSGGAVIVYAYIDDIVKIKDALEKNGFGTLDVAPARYGARIV